jgi:lipopolysaccharide/colanic/teichoic acid biosynthesis glycosyltransferase
VTKRTFDLLVATTALVLCLPLLVLIAGTSLLLNGRGPILFRQARVGRFGKAFHIHKFRTMHNSAGHAVTSDGDPRITGFGRILRATKLDELPQLLDVIAGSMSLVGPRPEVPRFVDCWPSQARSRILSVRPGITDPASIVYRHESVELANAADPERHYVTVVLPRKVAMYVEYVERMSLLEDLRIIIRTVRAVFTSELVIGADVGPEVRTRRLDAPARQAEGEEDAHRPAEPVVRP